jgi:hypothetical protein
MLRKNKRKFTILTSERDAIGGPSRLREEKINGPKALSAYRQREQARIEEEIHSTPLKNHLRWLMFF